MSEKYRLNKQIKDFFSMFGSIETKEGNTFISIPFIFKEIGNDVYEVINVKEEEK